MEATSQLLLQLQEIEKILANDPETQPLEESLPNQLKSILSAFKSLDSRAQAESLLEVGTKLWNHAIVREGKATLDQLKILTRVRHAAADCIYMSVSVLGGISTKFDIDEAMVLQFFTACSKKYMKNCGDSELAQKCLDKALELSKRIEKNLNFERLEKNVARALFDFHIANAQRKWDAGSPIDSFHDVQFCESMLKFIPEETDYLASVEYNLGLFLHQAKEYNKSLEWLNKSVSVRTSMVDSAMKSEKLARSLRLMAVNYLNSGDHDKALSYLDKAETFHHEVHGLYLYLKVSLSKNKNADVKKHLDTLCHDFGADLEVKIAAIQLLVQNERYEDVIENLEYLKENSSRNISLSLLLFEVLCCAKKYRNALTVLQTEISAIKARKINTDGSYHDDENIDEDGDGDQGLINWFGLCLSTGSAACERKDYAFAAEILDASLSLMELSSYEDKVTLKENEKSVRQLCVSSCIGFLESNLESTNETEIYFETALKHCEMLSKVDPEDSFINFLKARLYLLRRSDSLAAKEIAQVNVGVKGLKAGSLIRLACDARSADSKQTMIQCLLKILQSNAENIDHSKNGFMGSVFEMCIFSLIENTEVEVDDSKSEFVSLDENSLITCLKKGLEKLRMLGKEKMFGFDVEERISAIFNVAWNSGRLMSIKGKVSESLAFFEISYDIGSFRRGDVNVLLDQRMARLMSVTALLELFENSQDIALVEKSFEYIDDNRALLRTIENLDQNNTVGDLRNDQASFYLSLLEVYGHSKTKDLAGLKKAVVTAISLRHNTPEFLEKVAAVCYQSHDGQGNYSGLNESPEETALDLCLQCLQESLDLRLSKIECRGPETNVEDTEKGKREAEDVSTAALIREIIRLALSKRVEMAYAFALRAVNLLENENNFSYPLLEVEWLLYEIWDSSLLFYKCGKRNEAFNWGTLALRVCNATSLLHHSAEIKSFIDGVLSKK